MSARVGVVVDGLRLMNRSERLGALGLVGLMMLTGAFESAVVALVVPLVYVVVDASSFNATRIGQTIALWTGRPVDQMFGVFAIGLVILLLIASGVSWLATYLSEVHSARCRDRVSRELLGRLIDAPYLWVSKHSSILLVSLINDDVKTWRREFTQSMLLALQAVIMIVAPAMVVVAIAPGDGLIALCLVAAACALIVFAFRRRLRTVSTQSFAVQKVYLKQLMQTVTGIREIKISDRSEYFSALVKKQQDAMDSLIIRSRTLANAPTAIIMLLGQVGFIGTAAFLWSRGLSGPEFAAQIALIAVVVSRIVPAFNRLASYVTAVFRAAPVVENLLVFISNLDRALSVSGDAVERKAIPYDWKKITLNDVGFRYPNADRWSLEGASIELVRGKSYGFVGQSGAGKTTLVNLLLGLIEATRGGICIDGQPLSCFRIQDWHRRFGYVPQDSFLIDASLRENIRFGYNEIDDAKLRAVLNAAQLGSFLDAQPAGLDTRIGERGREMSGGQAQRVAIARALCRDPEILFLDEATSALDTVTETAIYDSIEATRNGRECLALIVAHRVTSLRRCDGIFLLDKGRIVDSGTYQELLIRSELFRALAAQSQEPGPANVGVSEAI